MEYRICKPLEDSKAIGSDGVFVPASITVDGGEITQIGVGNSSIYTLGACAGSGSGGSSLESVTAIDSTTASINGDGTAANPVEISVKVSTGVEARPDGLFVAVQQPPEVLPINVSSLSSIQLSGNGTSGNELQASIKLDNGVGNKLSIEPDGLYLAAGNGIEVSDQPGQLGEFNIDEELTVTLNAANDQKVASISIGGNGLEGTPLNAEPFISLAAGNRFTVETVNGNKGFFTSIYKTRGAAVVSNAGVTGAFIFDQENKSAFFIGRVLLDQITLSPTYVHPGQLVSPQAPYTEQQRFSAILMLMEFSTSVNVLPSVANWEYAILRPVGLISLYSKIENGLLTSGGLFTPSFVKQELGTSTRILPDSSKYPTYIYADIVAGGTYLM